MEWLTEVTAIDYVLLAILSVALIAGWIRGFVEIVTGFLVFGATLLIAGHYTDDIVFWLNRVFDLQHRVRVVLERRFILPGEAYKIPTENIPWNKALQWLQELPIPEAYKQTLAQQLSAWSQSVGSRTAADYILEQMANGILSIIVFTLLLLVLNGLLSLVGRVLGNQIKEIPIAGTLDRILGSLVALLQTTLVLSVLISLVMPVLSLYGLKWLGNINEHSQFLPYFSAFFKWMMGILFNNQSGLFLMF